MEKKALTTYEIARYCDVNPRTVTQWISDGKIRAYRTPGNHSRVKRQDFLEFLKEYNIPIPKEFVLKDIQNEKKRILIVDDDENMALSIERTLKIGKEYQLETAFDGFDAGRKVAEFKPDLVILDIKMPGMDGYEVTQRIKKMPQLFNTKIIAISAFFDQDGKNKILSLGANVCLDKPFNKEELLRKIKEIL
ncbi:MAG: response regulator [Candidatus Omnitrophica bacterium]|nr:response regulator [Candidatus Omnitrophota bacterium]